MWLFKAAVIKTVSELLCTFAANRKDVMKELLTTKGIHLRPREYFNFINFAQDKSGTKIYYEDYVTKLIEENERHREHLIKDYDTFKPSSGAK